MSLRGRQSLEENRELGEGREGGRVGRELFHLMPRPALAGARGAARKMTGGTFIRSGMQPPLRRYLET